MKLCFACRQLSSSRDLSADALFCPHCGLSFGVRRCTSCKKMPSSPRDANHCVHCGGTKLTDGTAYLDLSWMAKLLVLGSLFLGCYLFLDIPHVLAKLASPFLRLFCFLFACLVHWVTMLFLGCVLLHIVPGDLGIQIRKLYSRAVGLGWEALSKLLGIFFQGLFKLLVRLTAGKSSLRP